MAPRIIALTRYDSMGASSRVRFLQYIPELERLGFKVDTFPLLSSDYLKRFYAAGNRSPVSVAASALNRIKDVLTNRDTAIVWLQRELLPYIPFEIENLLLTGKKLVVDLDDAHHLYYKSAAFPLSLFLSSKIERIVRRADAVVVGNDNLAEMARKNGAGRVHFVPSAVNTNRIRPIQEQDRKPFTVGWIGTPVTARQSLPLIREPLKRFLQAFDAKCTLVGVGDSDFADIPATRVPWSESAEEQHLPRLTVGLCPLEDTDWNRGKSGYKIIQYMAAGTPTLASPVGFAAQIVENGKTGFHCSGAETWHSGMATLFNDTKTLSEMSQRARSEAVSKYDTKVAASSLCSVFQECLNA